MPSPDRTALIRDAVVARYLATGEPVTAAEIAAALAVSESTVRRTLREPGGLPKDCELVRVAVPRYSASYGEPIGYSTAWHVQPTRACLLQLARAAAPGAF